MLLAGGALASESAPLDDDELSEVIITGIERRYVAPTNRDGIGRVWVPVHINGKGPFRLVLDSGATRSAITANVARRLGIAPGLSPPVMLRGVTGSAVAQTIDVDSMAVGDLYVAPARLPIVADAFGGAEGLLGTIGMENLRIFVDFRNDFINLSQSRNRRAGTGFQSVPFRENPLKLLVIEARIGNMDVQAILDTGAQSSMGNLALRDALARQVRRNRIGVDEITGATGDMQTGTGARISPLTIAGLEIRDVHVTFGDMHIFETWKIGDVPAVVIGMDVLGLFDTLVIDYRRKEVHIKPRN